jgi:hypothetical protein
MLGFIRLFYTAHHYSVHSHVSLPLLDSGFQRRTFPFRTPEHESELYYDRRSVGQPVLVSSTQLGLTTRFLLLSDSCWYLLMWGALSDERTGLSFTIAPGPCQCRHFRVRLPWDSWTYFTVLDSETSLFVTSYDSHGYDGGIRPRLHTGDTRTHTR